MQTNLADWITDTPQGIEADSILRKCVHCGFCLATCPTYTLLGDELDSPRGRIYLMKQMLEGAPVTERTQLHLDRCLTCRACETTCPSGRGVRQAGRHRARAGRAEGAARARRARCKRWLLAHTLPRRRLFGACARARARVARRCCPPRWRARSRQRADAGAWPRRAPCAPHAGARRAACSPRWRRRSTRPPRACSTGSASRSSRRPAPGCCGAVSHHLNYQHDALAFVKANIDAWWPHVEAGAEAIVITASGCGTMVADYGHLLRDDPAYAAKAARISALAKDISRGGRRRARGDLPRCASRQARREARVPFAVQPAARPQGARRGRGDPRGCGLHAHAGARRAPVLRLGGDLLDPAARALAASCCATRSRALESAASPTRIATANIGCLAHIQSGTRVPVRHWIELLDERMGAG